MPKSGDPFLTDLQGHGYDYKATSLLSGTPRENLVNQELSILIFAPWFCYVFLLLTFGLPPPGLVWSFVAFLSWCLVLAAAGLTYKLQKQYSSPLYKLTTTMVLLSCLGGPLAGRQIFVTEMSSHWVHQHGVIYTNVVPTKSPDAYQDANIINFTESAHLELKQVIGMKPKGSHVRYCLAPIVDPQQPQTVHFFAAGVDCCGKRGHFECGDALIASARTGLMLPRWSSYNAERWEHFHRAAEKAAKVYDLRLPERPIFVKWFQDFNTAQWHLLHRGLVEAFVLSFLGLCVCSIVALSTHWSLTYHARVGGGAQKAPRSERTGCC